MTFLFITTMVGTIFFYLCIYYTLLLFIYIFTFFITTIIYGRCIQISPLQDNKVLLYDIVFCSNSRMIMVILVS